MKIALAATALILSAGLAIAEPKSAEIPVEIAAVQTDVATDVDRERDLRKKSEAIKDTTKGIVLFLALLEELAKR